MVSLLSKTIGPAVVIAGFAAAQTPAIAQDNLVIRAATSRDDASYCAWDSSTVRCWTREGGKAFLCIARGCVVQEEVADYLRRAESDAVETPDGDAMIQLGWGECSLTWSAAVCFIGDWSATATGQLIQIVDPQNQVTDH
ncbi:MAG: hypothetical protein REJ23_03100 [Brevundimonas sp.]|nr:hypothetical protein [Brevundimonas sp.]